MSKDNDSSFQCAFEKAVEVMNSSDSQELKGKIECEVCKGIFLKRHHFNNHLCKSKSKKTCPVCQKTFLSPYRLKEHLYLHSGEKPYECDVCKKRFPQKGYLSKHAIVHRKEKPFKCNFCKKSYTQADTLKEHIYTHTGEKPLKCVYCDRRFSNKSSYNMHVSIHEGAKTYECDVCLKQFSQKYYLKRHSNIHAFEKPFKCDICGKSFSLKSGLNEHMYCHSGEKPYKCEVCDKSFTRRTTLSMHREIHNTTESSKLPKCHVCNKRFMNKFLLDRHINVHRKLKCLVCDNKICICTPEAVLDQNIVSKRDMFKCQACSKIVFNRSFFMEHIAVHRDFICLDCDGIYATCDCFKHPMEDDYHEVVKDELKCTLCDIQFYHETLLYEHLLNHNCMVCCTSMEKCSCPKDGESLDDKSTVRIIKWKPLTELKSENKITKEENTIGSIKLESDDIGEAPVVEDLKIKDILIYATYDCFKPSKEENEEEEVVVKDELNLLNHKSMVCCTSMEEKCSCPKDNNDNDGVNSNKYKCKDTDDNIVESIKQEYDDIIDIGGKFPEDDSIKITVDEDSKRLKNEQQELSDTDEKKFVEMVSEVFETDTNLIDDIDEKPPVSDEFLIRGDNDFKLEYIKLEVKPMELADLINSDNFLE